MRSLTEQERETILMRAEAAFYAGIGIGSLFLGVAVLINVLVK